jgi:hypothetical protein
MKTFEKRAAQGEVNLQRVAALPDGLTAVAPEKGAYIVGHSESGSTHVIDAPGAKVFEQTKDVPAGMRIFYALIDEPTCLRQNAASPHEAIALLPGVFRIRISREFDPFAEQARRVAD